MDLNSIGLLGLYQNTAQTQGQVVLTPRERVEQARLIQAVKSVNQSGIFGSSDELTFSADPETGRPVIRLVNKDTKEVVRQIPAEYLLRLSEDPRWAAR
jgi:flagellar protein FlaG